MLRLRMSSSDFCWECLILSFPAIKNEKVRLFNGLFLKCLALFLSNEEIVQSLLCFVALRAHSQITQLIFNFFKVTMALAIILIMINHAEFAIVTFLLNAHSLQLSCVICEWPLN